MLFHTALLLVLWNSADGTYTLLRPDVLILGCIVGMKLTVFFCSAFTTQDINHARHTDTALRASNANEIMPMSQGSSCAVITPMTDTGKLDIPAFRRLLQFHVDAGTDNLCILGTTGEASVMSMDERAQVLRTAVEEVKGKVPILAGTGTIDPQHVKEMTLQAIDLGCDASLVGE